MTIKDIIETLKAEPNAECYAEDAADMLSDVCDDDPVAGIVDAVATVASELDAVSDTSEESTDEELMDIAETCSRGAHLLLHIAAEARERRTLMLRDLHEDTTEQIDMFDGMAD